MKNIVIVMVIIGCIIFNGGCVQQEIQIQKISGQELYQDSQNNKALLILDVRSLEEFNQGHIKDALNIPVEQIDKESMKLYNRNIKLVVYCRSGNRSSQAALKLRNLGFQYIYDLGGIDNWDYELVDNTNNNLN